GRGTSSASTSRSGPADMRKTRSPRQIASSGEWVTKKTVSCWSLQSWIRSSCMRRRIFGSRAPKGSSMSRMRGPRISVAAIATRAFDRPVEDERLAVGRREVRYETGDDAQQRRLAAARRPDDRYQFALAGQVRDGERHVLDGDPPVAPAPEDLGDLAEDHHV